MRRPVLLLILLLTVCMTEASLLLTAREALQTHYALTDASQSHNCRLWGMISASLPESVVLNHLVNLPYSLKNLGALNVNGWGLAYYNDSEPVVSRGEPAAYADPNFNLAAQELARSGAQIGVGHVRAASSGASDIPDPHPFIRQKGGKWWAFGHNGGVSKTILESLIGPGYLAQNPPSVGDNWDDPRVVDSELYMLYILKCIEEESWNALSGIAKAVIDISSVSSGGMNFFLTDGETLWGFRRGLTLYYQYNATAPQFVAIASQPPTINENGWTMLSDYNLITLTVGEPPFITTISHQFAVSISPINTFILVGQAIEFASSTSGSYPPYAYQWCLNGTSVTGATLPRWEFTFATTGVYTICVNVTDSLGNTAKSNQAIVSAAPLLMTRVSPMYSTMTSGEPVIHTSTTSGGFPMYTYQWYLNNSAVLGATSANWAFTPTVKSGTFRVTLQVTDSRSNTAESETAILTVNPPAGGNSSLAKCLSTEAPILYVVTVSILTMCFAIAKRKTTMGKSNM